MAQAPQEDPNFKKFGNTLTPWYGFVFLVDKGTDGTGCTGSYNATPQLYGTERSMTHAFFNGLANL